MAGKYRKLELLGQGTFGKAWLVKKQDTDRKYVIKEIKVTGLTEKERMQTLTEVEALAACRHFNVIRYRDAYVSQGALHIVMEYAAGGDLHQKIGQQHNIHFDESIILNWLVQICFGLNFIHGMHIIHRDLKTQNLFLTGDNVIKVGDFGVARILRDYEMQALTQIGTPLYLSPEICQHQPYDSKSDMWALGCVLYNLCTLVPPFVAPDFNSLISKIMTGDRRPIPGQYSSLVADLVDYLLSVNPSERPSAEQVLGIPAIEPHVDKYLAMVAATKESVASPIVWRCDSPTPKQRKFRKHRDRLPTSSASPVCKTPPPASNMHNGQSEDGARQSEHQSQNTPEKELKQMKSESGSPEVFEVEWGTIKEKPLAAKGSQSKDQTYPTKQSPKAVPTQGNRNGSKRSPQYEQRLIRGAIISSPKLDMYKDTLRKRYRNSHRSRNSSDENSHSNSSEATLDHGNRISKVDGSKKYSQKSSQKSRQKSSQGNIKGSQSAYPVSKDHRKLPQVPIRKEVSIVTISKSTAKERVDKSVCREKCEVQQDKPVKEQRVDSKTQVLQSVAEGHKEENILHEYDYIKKNDLPLQEKPKTGSQNDNPKTTREEANPKNTLQKDDANAPSQEDNPKTASQSDNLNSTYQKDNSNISSQDNLKPACQNSNSKTTRQRDNTNISIQENNPKTGSQDDNRRMKAEPEKPQRERKSTFTIASKDSNTPKCILKSSPRFSPKPAKMAFRFSPGSKGDWQRPQKEYKPTKTLKSPPPKMSDPAQSATSPQSSETPTPNVSPTSTESDYMPTRDQWTGKVISHHFPSAKFFPTPKISKMQSPMKNARVSPSMNRRGNPRATSGESDLGASPPLKLKSSRAESASDVSSEPPCKSLSDDETRDQSSEQQLPTKDCQAMPSPTAEDQSSPEFEVINYFLQSIKSPTMISTLRAFLVGRLGIQPYTSLYNTLARAWKSGGTVTPSMVPQSAWLYMPLVAQILQLKTPG